MSPPSCSRFRCPSPEGEPTGGQPLGERVDSDIPLDASEAGIFEGDEGVDKGLTLLALNCKLKKIRYYL